MAARRTAAAGAASPSEEPPKGADRSIRLDDWIGHRIGDVSEALTRSGIDVQLRDETLAGPLSALERLLPERRVGRGDHVLAYVMNDRVLRFAVDVRARRRDEASTLLARLDELEQRVVRLEGGAEKSPAAPRRRGSK